MDFKLNPDMSGGVLLVEPGSKPAASIAGIELPPNVEVREAAGTKLVRESSMDQVLAAARKIGGASVLGVSYDAFANAHTIWTAAGDRNVPPANLMSDVTAAGRAALKSGLQVSETEVGSLFRGGQLAVNTPASCTTGFGVWDGRNAYLEAGHCGTGTWHINGNTSTSVEHRHAAGYLDHEMIVAGGASYLVRISPPPIAEVDMEATAYHIFLNGMYCHYGQFSNATMCGNITAQNVINSGDGLTFYTSQSTARCRPGDSGGPVWEPVGQRKPSGTINGGDIISPPVGGNYLCRYVALDDQLNGSGWFLL